MDPLDAATYDPEQTRQPESAGLIPEALFGTFGKYKIVEKIGQGGMGAVYRAIDTVLEREVAIKVPIFSGSDRASTLARFTREAIAAANLRHPVICPIFEYNEQSGIPFIVTPFLHGRSLQAQLDQSGPWLIGQTLELGIKLAGALDYAHRSNVVHRDIKPQNIFLEQDGLPLILDFGLAKFANPNREQFTQMGEILGTPAYMPPEQIDASIGPIGPAADIYALGMTLYYVLTGRTAFSDRAEFAIPQILLDPPPLPSSVGPSGRDLSSVDALIVRALAKKPHSRYQSMHEFAQAMQCVLETPHGQQPACDRLPDLRIAGSGHRYHPHPTQKSIRIGRQRNSSSNAGLPINDLVVRAEGDESKSLRISRQHLEIISLENGWAAIDRSQAGIAINGVLAIKNTPVPIHHNDIIQVAGVIEIVVLKPVPTQQARADELVGFEATMGDFFRDGEA